MIGVHILNPLHVLTKAYTEPHRRYHTLEHIAHMFNVARDRNIKLSKIQIAAIWWHDSVYVPGATDNEDRSIDLMLKHEIFKSQLYEDIAVEMIKETKYHRPTFIGSAVVCDLDMIGFVENESERLRINEQIEQEFLNVGFTKDHYRLGRIKFLEHLLDEPIFYSNEFITCNDIAHKNIEHDLIKISRTI